MKKHCLFLAVVGLVFAGACQNERKSAPPETDSVDLTPDEIPVEEAVGLPALPYFVYFDEQAERMEIERDITFDRTALQVDSLAGLLRMHYPEVPLSVTRQEGSTLHLEISDPMYLTQQMGSSGAKTYLVEVTYAFTEIPGIDEVNIVFEEGDHAVPGRYTRGSFKDDNIILRE